MTRHVQFDREKLKAVILHVVGTVAPARLGAVKLHKVLYFADMIFYATTGRPITGAQYRKRPFGPTCVALLPTLRDLEREGAVFTTTVDFFGRRKTEYHLRSEPAAGRLTQDELALIDEVADFVCNQNSARSISDYSHQAPWELTEFGEVIGYDTALLLFPTEPSPEAFEIVGTEAAQIENTRSRKNAMGFTDYRTFRDRILAEIGDA